MMQLGHSFTRSHPFVEVRRRRRRMVNAHLLRTARLVTQRHVQAASPLQSGLGKCVYVPLRCE